MKNRTQKINFRAVMAAVAAGGGFELAMQGLAKKVDFVGENYLVTSSLSAGVVGSGLLYFGRDEISQASGYALLGVSGQKGAAKLATLSVTGDGSVNGLGPRTTKNLRGMLSRRRPGADAVKSTFVRPGFAGRGTPQPQASASMQSNRNAPNYTALAYADTIYSIPQ